MLSFMRVVMPCLMVALASPVVAAKGLQVGALTCEHRTNPLGIDVVTPRLSWKLLSEGKGVQQTAYQVTAWDEKGTLWDTKKVMASDSWLVRYAGKPLRSMQPVRWKVRVWDNHGATAESEVGTWEMGLLKANDWKGQWISSPREDVNIIKIVRPGLMWIWYPEGNPAVEAPAATRLFRTTFVLPPGEITRGYLGVAADGKGEVSINGKRVGTVPGIAQLAPFDVTTWLVPGRNVIEGTASNGSDAGGFIAQLQVQMKNKPPVVVSTNGKWEASKDGVAWVNAMEAAPVGKGRYWSSLPADIVNLTKPGPVVQLRLPFTVEKPVKAARLYVTALGIYEAEINGQKVGTDLLAPGWTDYNKRVQYQTYDVTPLVVPGKNAIGAYLSDGWYAGKIGFSGMSVYGLTPKFLANLVVQYTDGKRDVITTGPAWKTASGAIVEADLQNGETFDARKATPGFATAAYNDAAWKPVLAQPRSAIKPALVADRALPVRAFETREGTITQPKPGVFIYDFGQNMPGVARLKAKAPAGTEVTLRFGEMLNSDGTLYTENLRTAKATDKYTFAGKAEGEVWQPRFTLHGFRYAELTGWPAALGPPNKATLTAVVIHSDIPRTGTFTSSSALVNQLVSNIDWGQRGNFISVPTDCPQRDERLGWMGDAQIFVRTAARNRDVAAFFTKWLTDVVDAQSSAGAFSDVAPRAPGTSESTPAWGDAGVIVPWVMWQEYGDRDLLARLYPSMVKWVKYVHSKNPTLLWTNEQGNAYGDWLSINADTDKHVLATAFFAQSAQILSQSAAALGKEADTRTYAELANRIRAAFTKAYVDPDGKIKGDTQTAYVLALRFDMLPPELRAKAIAHLVKNIEAHANHLTTGFLGVGHLLPALTRFGQLDKAYTLLNNETFPSWGYSIKQGATTIWERWDGWTKEKGFQSPSMNSFNHYSLGSVGEWLYDTVAGISPALPGYKQIRIAPRPGGGFTQAGAEEETPYGRVKSRWTRKSKELRLAIDVPVNTTAVVVLPGPALATPPEANAFTAEPNAFVVGSGTYEFVAALNN